MFTQKRGIKTLIFASCLFIFVFNSTHFSSAGIWKDDFNDGNLDGWTHPADQVKDRNWNSVWKSENGVLDVTIDVDVPPDKPLLSSPVDFLQLTAFPISSFRLTVEVIILIDEGPTSTFGIVLGMSTEDVPYIGRFHAFTRSSSFGLYIASDGRSELVMVGVGDQKDYPNISCGQPMKVVFESGSFRLFSQDTLLLEFMDENYPKIELVGIFAWGSPNFDLHGVMDDFMISGPNLAVNVKGKLTTTWGDIKNESIRF